MEKNCKKCGTVCDPSTGLCPVCDAAQLEAFREIFEETDGSTEGAEENTLPEIPLDEKVQPIEESEEELTTDEVKRNGILAIIASFLVIIIIVSVVMVGVSRGWIGGKAKTAQLKSAYSAFLNRKSIPEFRMFDLSHPMEAVDGVVAAKQLDLNNDKSDEFVIAHYDKVNDEILLKLSCYEYNSKSIIQGKQVESDGTEGVELNATVTVFTQKDYDSQLTDGDRTPDETLIYEIKDKTKSYIAVEHLTYDEGCTFTLQLFSLENGVFKESADITAEDISNDGSIIVSSKQLPSDIKINNSGFTPTKLDYWEYIKDNYADKSVLYMASGDGSYQYDVYYASAEKAVEDFMSEFRSKKPQYLLKGDEGEAPYALVKPDEDSMIFSEVYYYKNLGADNEELVYEVKDYTDYLLLLYPENKTLYDDAAAKNEEEEKDAALNNRRKLNGDVQYGEVVRISGDTYYWRYNGNSFATSAANGDYDYKTSAENELICRSADGEERVILETNGGGAIAVAGGKIFYQKVTSGYRSFNIYSCNLDGSSSNYVSEGVLCGVVQGGAYVIYSGSGDERRFTSIHSIRLEDMEESTIAYNAIFLFINDDKIYYQAEEESNSDARSGMTTLCCVNGNGSSNHAVFYTAADLYEDADYDSEKCYIISPYVYKDYVYYAYGSYDDGKFNGGALVKCKLDGSDGEVVGTTRTDTFTVDAKGNVYSANDDKYVNGYTFADGEARLYDPASDTVKTVISKADYSTYSDLSLGDEGNQLLSLRFEQSVGSKQYFALTRGEYDKEEDGERVYTFRSYALFEKDTQTGEVKMIYSADKSSNDEDE